MWLKLKHFVDEDTNADVYTKAGGIVIVSR